MTDELAFEAIALDDLPSAPKGSDPASVALGNAVLAVANATTAAGDPLPPFADRKDAINRAAVIKRGVRAAGGPSDGMKVATRILASADGYRVAILLVPATPAKPKGNRGRNIAS
jgi:hypothetical protein